jgi:hypothetical protein
MTGKSILSRVEKGPSSSVSLQNPSRDHAKSFGWAKSHWSQILASESEKVEARSGSQDLFFKHNIILYEIASAVATVTIGWMADPQVSAQISSKIYTKGKMYIQPNVLLGSVQS